MSYPRQLTRSLLLYFAIACALTWPLALSLSTCLPLGAESAATVPLFNLWTLRWNADRLAHGYTDYWNAPIFYPAKGAFALSEPQPLTGFVFSLLDMLTRNPITAYNLALLLILTLNGGAAQYLLLTLGVSATPAWLGGALAVGMPFVLNELGVLQLTVVFPIFFTFAALKTFGDRPTLRSAWLMGGAAAATFLTCAYYGLFLSLFLLWGGLCYVRRRHFRWKSALQLMSAMLMAGLWLWPVLPTQAQFTRVYTRSSATISANSAQAADYLRPGSPALGYQQPWLKTSGGSGQKLYPGTGFLALAVLGMVAAWRQRQRRWVLLSVTGIVLAILFSLGLNLEIAHFQPYQILRGYYPGFAQLRSPFRFAVFAQIFLVGLAGFGLAWVWRHPGWGWRALAVGLAAVSLLEVATPPAKLYPFPFDRIHPPWIRWLSEQPPGVVAMAPFPASGRTRDYEATTVAMLQSLEHRHPLVNGYSGLFPSAYLRMRGAMQKFPDANSWMLLSRADTAYLVIDCAWLTELRLKQLEGASVRRVYADQSVVIYQFGEALNP